MSTLLVRSTAAPIDHARPVARRQVSKRAISIVVVVGILLAWTVTTSLGWVPPLFLPSPQQVFEQFLVVAREGYAGATLWQHAGASLLRVLLAFAIAVTIAIPLGVAMGLNRWFEGAFEPIIEFYWPLPPLAYLPLVIIWLGIGETSKIVLLTAAMLPPICLAAQAGVRSGPIERTQAALSLGATHHQIFRLIALPSALPEIFTGLRIAMGVGWSTLVAAELVAATKGIGFMILSASNFLATDIVFIGIAVIAVLAIGCGTIIRVIERILVPWKGRS